MTAAPQSLITLEQALCLDQHQNFVHHQRHLNPRLATLLEVLNAAKPLVRASGEFFWDCDDNQYIDFLGGFAALHLGHNHPSVCKAVETVRSVPNLVEGLSVLAGALAYNLACLTPGALQRVHFANSGAEVVDTAIKLARAATGRVKLVACHKGFHGRTIGALSLMDQPEARDPFVPLLSDVTFVPFGNSEALERALYGRDVAAFVVEPIQGEAGIVVPPKGYLRTVRELCTRYGALLVADEVQTGLGRTGTMFAMDAESVVPDIMLLGKALGGGIMPLSALLTTDDLYRAGKADTPRSPCWPPTYGGNTRACAAGLATLEVLIEERLTERAAASGAYLLKRLQELQQRQPLIADVRGRGLMIGVEFAPVPQSLATLAADGSISHPSYKDVTILVMMELLSQHRIMTALTFNNPNVLRLQPPLNIAQEHLDYCVASLDNILERLASTSPKTWPSWESLLHTYF